MSSGIPPCISPGTFKYRFPLTLSDSATLVLPTPKATLSSPTILNTVSFPNSVILMELSVLKSIPTEGFV